MLVARLTALSGSSAYTRQDPTALPGIHVHYGRQGEVDVNVCSDGVPVGYARCAARVRTESGVASRHPSGVDRQVAPAAAGTIGDNGAYSPSYLQAAVTPVAVGPLSNQAVAVAR